MATSRIPISGASAGALFAVPGIFFFLIYSRFFLSLPFFILFSLLFFISPFYYIFRSLFYSSILLFYFSFFLWRSSCAACMTVQTKWWGVTRCWQLRRIRFSLCRGRVYADVFFFHTLFPLHSFAFMFILHFLFHPFPSFPSLYALCILGFA